MINFFGGNKIGFLGCLLFVCFSQSAVGDESGDIGEHIDQLNQQLQHKASKSLSHADFQKYLGEANNVLRSNEFDVEYQKIREEAFSTGNFSKANAFSKRAEPAFDISFDGDYDYKQLHFDFFKSIVKAGTIDWRFLNAYQQYDQYLFSTANNEYQDSESCSRAEALSIPFDFPMEYTEENKQANVDRKKLLSEYKTLANKLEPGLMKDVSLNAIRCLQIPAKKHQ